MHEKYNAMSDKEKEAFTLGRQSVLEDFDAVCLTDAFVGFSSEEWTAIKKFFAFNKLISKQ